MKRKLSLFIIGIMLSAFIPASALAAQTPATDAPPSAALETADNTSGVRVTFTTQKTSYNPFDLKELSGESITVTYEDGGEYELNDWYPGSVFLEGQEYYALCLNDDLSYEYEKDFFIIFKDANGSPFPPSTIPVHLGNCSLSLYEGESIYDDELEERVPYIYPHTFLGEKEISFDLPETIETLVPTDEKEAVFPKESSIHVYSFTPNADTEGIYNFCASGNLDWKESALFSYDSASGLLIPECTAQIPPSNASYDRPLFMGSTFSANKTYYFVLNYEKDFYDEPSEDIPYRVHFKKSLPVTDIQLDTPPTYTKVPATSHPVQFAEGMVVKLTYSDGSSEKVEMGTGSTPGGLDSYGNKVLLSIYDETGETLEREEDWDYSLDAGKYLLTAEVNSCPKRLSVPIEVIPLEEAAADHKFPENGNSISMPALKNLECGCALFTPKTDGSYIFTSTSMLDIYRCSVYDIEEQQELETSYNYGENYCFQASLQGGKSYVLMLYLEEGGPAFTLTAERAKSIDPDSLRLIIKNNNPNRFTSDYGWYEEDFAVEFSYTGETEKILLRSWERDIYSNGFDFYVEHEDGPILLSDFSWENGTYQIFAALENDSSIRSQSVTVTFAETIPDYNSLPVLKENTEITLKDLDGEKMYLFTPASDGHYKLSSDTFLMWTVCQVTDNRLDYLANSRSNASAFLEKGKRYIIYASCSEGTASTKILKMTSLRAGQPLEFSLARDASDDFLGIEEDFLFVPEESGNYYVHIECLSQTEDYIWMEVKSQDDNLGYTEGRKDMWSWSNLHMTKGTPYWIQFHSKYDTPERYRINIIHRSKVPRVTAMEVVNKKSTDGYPAGFGSIYAEEFVDVKLTYQNGGSTILPAGTHDAYGNRTRLSDFPESSWDEHGVTLDYNLELYSSFLPDGEKEPGDEDGSYETPSISIPIQLQFSSDISSLKEIEEGRSLCKTSDKNVEYYLFRPKTDGTYSFDTDNGYIRSGELNDSEIDLFYNYGYNNLKTGHTYIIEANRKLYGKTSQTYDMQASEYHLDIIHHKNVIKLDILNPPSPFVSPYQNPGAGARIKAVYEDGTEEIITGQSEKDFFGNYLSYTYQVISNEKARVCISFGNQFIYCDVSRLPVSSLPKLTLGKASELTTTALGEKYGFGTGTVALFVPQKNGIYKFDAAYTGKQKEKPSIFIYDAETESLVENWETLLAGHTYVICASCSEWSIEQSVQMSVSERSSETVNPCASGHTWNGGTVTKQPTALAAGTRTFHCSACGAQKTETIAKLTPTLSVNAKKLPLKIRQSTSKLKVSNLAAGDYVVSYASSNPKIAKVSKSGKITAGKKAGKAIITITLASGKKEKITVQVQKKAVKTQKISGLNKKLSLKKGKKAALKPVITPITSLEKVTYRTSNKKVATVNKKGVIQAKKPGKAKITVKSGKKKFTVTLTVKK